MDWTSIALKFELHDGILFMCLGVPLCDRTVIELENGVWFEVLRLIFKSRKLLRDLVIEEDWFLNSLTALL
jgi:hypothetical protein